MQASVIVPTCNRRELVLRTVRTLLRQDFPASEHEILVVVDGSTDGTAEAVRALDERVCVVTQENRGPAAARNTGAHAARGAVLIFVDDDMQCVPSLVREHVAAHQAACGREIVGLGAIYVSRDHPQNLAAEYFNRTLGAAYLRQQSHPGEPWPENVWSFANTSIRREVLMRVGGFDERFRMREDGEAGVRLLEAGVRQQFVRKAVAYQWCAKSAEQLVRDSVAFAESDLLFMRTHPGKEPHGYFQRLRAERGWKKRLRRMLVAHPVIADVALAPLWWLGRLPVGVLRKTAVKALLLHCGVHWLHRLIQISGRSIEHWAGE